MADDNDTTADEGSVFTRPRFLIAAVIVVIIALLGAIVAVRVARTNDAEPAPPTSTAAAPTATPDNPGATPSDASVCGLEDGDQGPVTSGPAATWKYEGTIAYPESPNIGPAKTAAEGYRYCFQHSPSGAVLMAANALAQGSDPQVGNVWAMYALGEGPYRDQLLGKISTVTGAENARLKVNGFRVLSFNGDSARVDLAVRVSSQNQNLALSGVYELIWQGGDWKISAAVERPLDTATIPDLAGYVLWGE